MDVYLQVVHLSTLRIDLWITDQLNADKVLAFYHSVMIVTHGDPRVIHIDINSPWSMLSVFFIKHTEPRGLLSQLKYCTHCSHFWSHFRTTRKISKIFIINIYHIFTCWPWPRLHKFEKLFRLCTKYLQKLISIKTFKIISVKTLFCWNILLKYFVLQ